MKTVRMRSRVCSLFGSCEACRERLSGRHSGGASSIRIALRTRREQLARLDLNGLPNPSAISILLPYWLRPSFAFVMDYD